MINKIKIKNFRSIKEQDVDLSQINIIYGPNSSGKSSLLYSLFIFKNIIMNPNQQTIAFFNFGFTNLGDFRTVIYEHREDKEMEFGIEVKNGETLSNYSVNIQKNNGKFLFITDNPEGPNLQLDVTFPYPSNLRDEKTIDVEEGLIPIQSPP